MRDYLLLADHYSDCFRRHGDCAKGADWPNEEDTITRYDVMLGILNGTTESRTSILDVGCGAARFLDHIKRRDLSSIEYVGVDVCSEAVAAALAKHPDADLLTADFLSNELVLPDVDYAVMNGIFNEKRELSFDQMWTFLTRCLQKAWDKCRVGMAFNLMSVHVDWTRDDLFHVPCDMMMDWMNRNVTRHVTVRHDYGLYEYTVYALRNPNIKP